MREAWITQQLEKRKSERFVEFLQRLEERKDRGALAALRRGLGMPPGSAPEMHRYVAPWTGGERSRWREDVYYIVAALFAFHPCNWPRDDSDRYTNLGSSFARIAVGDSHGAVERRFTALLGVHVEDLPVHLRHAVSLLKSKDAPIDWARLLRDLMFWNDEDRWVQRNWARAFWREAPQDAADDDTNT